MATAPSPPILIWSPGGGFPGGPVSNPPVYSQAGITPLIIGQNYVDVVFSAVQVDTSWVLVECEVVNTTDASPLNIWPGITTSRTTAGFRLYFNGLPDTGNYYLHWAVSGVNIAPIPATSYLLSGPANGGIGIGAVFTVKLPPSTALSGILTVTPSDGGGGGSFSPTTVTLSITSASATFTYTPASYGAKTISTTNSGTLSDPAPLTFTPVASTYTLTGPSSGTVSVASTNFTVALPVGGVVLSAVTFTPNDSSGGGTFTPTSVNLTTGAPSATFTYTPGSIGVKTIATTNSGTLIDPGSLSYTSSAPTPHLLNTLISYWKMDEATGTGARIDSQSTNNLTPAGAGVTAVAGRINNGVSFPGDFLLIASNTSLQVTGDFTFSFWIKFSSQSAVSVLLSKWDAPGIDYAFINDPANGIQFGVDLSGGGTVVQGPILTNGTWYHIVGWYDSGVAQVNLRINDTTSYQHAAGAALIQSTSALTIGATAGSTFPPSAVMDEAGFWKRKLTAGEITALYGGGSGLPYSSFTL